MAAGGLRRFDPRLPRDVWLLQAGGLVNSFGNGVVLPFLVIYLHDVRGIGLGTAGLVVAVSAAAQLAAGLFAGPVIDRVGPKLTLGSGVVLQAVGLSMLPLVRHAWQAFALLAVEGAGAAGFWPSQSTLISRLTPPGRRHAAFAQQRVTMNLGIGLGGIAGGFVAHVSSPGTFTTLFVLDALTFLGYVVALRFIRDPGAVPVAQGAPPASYRAVLRDRTFVGLWSLNFLFVAAGYSLLTLYPQFMRDHGHVSEREIGIVFGFNTGVIVLAQLPISHWIEGRRRMRALVLMPLCWAVAWLLVDGTGAWLEATPAFVLFAVAAGMFGIGECFHGPAHQALVADIGPEHLRGRYFAIHSLSWGLAGAVGPAAGGFFLAAAPLVLWPLAAGVCLVAAGGVLAIERYIPPPLRRIPHEEATIPAFAGPAPV
ncbi:MAG TPA: MFS transporter [Gaiellaceae bacterium]|jgi:MFS family permease